MVKVELVAPGMIEHCFNTPGPKEIIEPKETFELDFSVQAKARGDLSLRMKVQIEDEGGPPVSIIDLTLGAKSG
jgi:hypothetical protein